MFSQLGTGIHNSPEPKTSGWRQILVRMFLYSSLSLLFTSLVKNGPGASLTRVESLILNSEHPAILGQPGLSSNFWLPQGAESLHACSYVQDC